MLSVDLNSTRCEVEAIPQRMYRQFLGGYGIGVALLLERMDPSCDPLGPENILGFAAGLDGILFRQISDTPVYLLIEPDPDGIPKAQVLAAAQLWGKDCYETEDLLKERHGSDCQVACIGPAGEKLSMVAEGLRDFGTPWFYKAALEEGDVPVKNWAGSMEELKTPDSLGDEQVRYRGDFFAQ
ncbi:MAG: aldehyde ferredoxin oxidoreductase N-terminal domain-containing protein [Spirochaetia bacterium]